MTALVPAPDAFPFAVCEITSVGFLGAPACQLDANGDNTVDVLDVVGYCTCVCLMLGHKACVLLRRAALTWSVPSMQVTIVNSILQVSIALPEPACDLEPLMVCVWMPEGFVCDAWSTSGA
eukprot:scaffold641_cov490-Prasinococcus_capsulatus_cf.AAC.14